MFEQTIVAAHHAWQKQLPQQILINQREKWTSRDYDENLPRKFV